jgi:hypothetical protein
MISDQSLTNNIAPGINDSAYAGVLTNNGQYMPPFAQWCPNWTDMELFVQGHIPRDTIIGSQPELYIELDDDHSRGAIQWDHYSTLQWQRTGKGQLAAQAVNYVLMPFGYFEARVRLIDCVRNQEKAYVNTASNFADGSINEPWMQPDQAPGVGAIIATPPDWAPILFQPDGKTPLLDATGKVQYDPNYVWPATTQALNDSTGKIMTLTLAGPFDPSRLTAVAVELFNAQSGATSKLDLYTVRFRPITGPTGLTYVDDYYLINSVAGIKTQTIIQQTVTLGEGYQMIMQGSCDAAYKYLSTANTFHFKDNTTGGYPFTFYSRFMIRNPDHVNTSLQVPGCLVSAGGASSVADFSVGIRILMGIPQAYLQFPNFDFVAAPAFDPSGAPSLFTGEAAFMPVVPPVLSGKYGANWCLKTEIEYEVVGVFQDALVDSANGRQKIFMYILESGTPYLIGQMPAVGSLTANRQAGATFAGYCPLFTIGTSSFEGGIGAIFGGDVLETRIYDNVALTAAQIATIVKSHPTSDPLASLLTQYWTLPTGQDAWKSYIAPTTPLGTTFMPGIVNGSVDVLVCGATSPTIEIDVSDIHTAGYYSKMSLVSPAPLGENFTITLNLDTATTPSGTALSPSALTIFNIYTNNAPVDGATIHLLKFVQQNYVLTYQPTALPLNRTFGSPQSSDEYHSIYYRYVNPNVDTSGSSVTVQIDVYDGGSDHFSLPLTFSLPSTSDVNNPGTYDGEIQIPNLFTPAGRLLDETHLTAINTSQVSGSSVQIERLDIRITKNIFFNSVAAPYDLDNGPWLQQFAGLDVSQGSQEMIVEGTCYTPGGADVSFRIDDDITKSLGGGYYNYSTAAFSVGYGPYRVVLPLSGLRTNSGGAGWVTRPIDINALTQIIVFGSGANVNLVRITGGFQFKNGGRGWQFLNSNGQQAAGFDLISMPDTGAYSNSFTPPLSVMKLVNVVSVTATNSHMVFTVPNHGLTAQNVWFIGGTAVGNLMASGQKWLSITDANTFWVESDGNAAATVTASGGGTLYMTYSGAATTSTTMLATVTSDTSDGFYTLQNRHPVDTDAIVSNDFEGVGTITLPYLTPGTYHVQMWTEWEGEYESVSNYMCRTITLQPGTANSKIAEAVDYTSHTNPVQDWVADKWLRGRAQEADLLGLSTPWDTFGSLQSHKIDINNVVIGSNGNLVITYSNVDRIYGAVINAVVIEPQDNQIDSAQLEATRKLNYNSDWPLGQIPSAQSWPVLTGGHLELVEVPHTDNIQTPDDYLLYRNNLTPLSHDTALGAKEYVLFHILAGAGDPDPVLTIVPPTSGAHTLPITTRFGHWRFARDGNLLTPNAGHLRGDINLMTLTANLPRPVSIEIDVPSNAIAGTYIGSVTIVTHGLTVTKNYTVNVLAKTLPAMNKSVGFYLFEPWGYETWNGVSSTDYTAYNAAKLADLSVLASQGLTGLAPVDNQMDTGAYGNAAVSGLTTNQARFLDDMARYKTAGFGTQPYFLYGAYKDMALYGNYGNAVGRQWVVVAQYLVSQLTPGHFGGSVTDPTVAINLTIAHNNYRASVGITDTTITLVQVGATDIALNANYVHVSINGSYVPSSDLTYNGNNYFAFQSSAGLSWQPTDQITIEYDMSNYMGLSSNGQNPSFVTGPRLYAINRMEAGFTLLANDIKAAFDIMRANPGTYGTTIPYIAIADEPKSVSDSSGNYNPISDTGPYNDQVIAAGTAIHATIPYAKTLAASGPCGPSDLVTHQNDIDIFLLNDGYGNGAPSTTMLAAVAAIGKEAWIYNMSAYRALSGFVMWAWGYGGYIYFAANNILAAPFDPTDDTEGDKNFIPYMPVLGGTRDIDAGLGAMAEGIIDHRWCQWLDSEVAASNASAIALKASLIAAIPTQYTATANTVYGTTPADMNGWRQQIIDFAKTV